jgi:hypothetical protein
MRFLFWFCAALIVVSATMSMNLWRELRTEREQAIDLRMQISDAVARERAASRQIRQDGSR